ncbi:MAG: hypothetical protein P8J20_07515 [Novosphingobium sp.]|nr:hypothetical protein [Novosphingobium sp.]
MNLSPDTEPASPADTTPEKMLWTRPELVKLDSLLGDVNGGLGPNSEGGDISTS